MHWSNRGGKEPSNKLAPARHAVGKEVSAIPVGITFLPQEAKVDPKEGVEVGVPKAAKRSETDNTSEPPVDPHVKEPHKGVTAVEPEKGTAETRPLEASEKSAENAEGGQEAEHPSRPAMHQPYRVSIHRPNLFPFNGPSEANTLRSYFEGEKGGGGGRGTVQKLHPSARRDSSIKWGRPASASTSFSEDKPPSSTASSRSLIFRRNSSLNTSTTHQWVGPARVPRPGGVPHPPIHNPHLGASFSGPHPFSGQPARPAPHHNTPVTDSGSGASTSSMPSLGNGASNTSGVRTASVSGTRTNFLQSPRSRRQFLESSQNYGLPVSSQVSQKRKSVAIVGAQTAAANAATTGIFQTGTRNTFTTPAWQNTTGGGGNGNPSTAAGGVAPPFIGVPGNPGAGGGNPTPPSSTVASGAAVSGRVGTGGGVGNAAAGAYPNLLYAAGQGQGVATAFLPSGASMYSFLQPNGASSIHTSATNHNLFGATGNLSLSGTTTATGGGIYGPGTGNPPGGMPMGTGGVDTIEEELLSLFHELTVAMIQNSDASIVDPILMGLVSSIEIRALANLDPESRDVFLEHCIRELLSELLRLSTEDSLLLATRIIELLLPQDYTNPSHKFLRFCRVLSTIMQKEGPMKAPQMEAKRVLGLILEYDSKQHHVPLLKGYLEKEIRDQISFANLHLQARTVNNKKTFPSQLHYFVMMIEEISKVCPRYVSSPVSLRDDIIRIATNCCVSEPELETAAYECLVAFFKPSAFLNTKTILRETKMICSNCEILNSARYNEVSVICQLKVLRALFVSRPSKFSGDKNKIAAAVTAQFPRSKSPELRMAICDLLPLIAPWDVVNPSRRNVYCALIMNPVKNVRNNHRKSEELNNIAMFIHAVGYEVFDGASRNNLDSILFRYVSHPEVQEACWKVIAAILVSLRVGKEGGAQQSHRNGGHLDPQSVGKGRLSNAPGEHPSSSSLSSLHHGTLRNAPGAGKQPPGNVHVPTSFPDAEDKKNTFDASSVVPSRSHDPSAVSATPSTHENGLSRSSSCSNGSNTHMYLRVGYGKMATGSHPPLPPSATTASVPLPKPTTSALPAPTSASTGSSPSPTRSTSTVPFDGPETASTTAVPLSSKEEGNPLRRTDGEEESAPSIPSFVAHEELSVSRSHSLVSTSSSTKGNESRVGNISPRRSASNAMEDLVNRCIPFISKTSLTEEFVRLLSIVWHALPGVEGAIRTELYKLMHLTLQEAAEELAQDRREKGKKPFPFLPKGWSAKSIAPSCRSPNLTGPSRPTPSSSHSTSPPRPAVWNGRSPTETTPSGKHTVSSECAYSIASSSGTLVSSTTTHPLTASPSSPSSTKEVDRGWSSLYSVTPEWGGPQSREESRTGDASTMPYSRWSAPPGGGEVPAILPAMLHHDPPREGGASSGSSAESASHPPVVDAASSVETSGAASERTKPSVTPRSVGVVDGHDGKPSPALLPNTADSIALMSLTVSGNALSPSSLTAPKPNDLTVAMNLFAAREVTNITQLQSVVSTMANFVTHTNLKVRRSVYRGIMLVVGGWIRYARERKESTHSPVLLTIFEAYIKYIPSELHFSGRQEATLQLTTNDLFLPYLADNSIITVLQGFLINTPRSREIGVDLLYTISSWPKFSSSTVLLQALSIPVEACVLLLEYSDDIPMLFRGMSDLRCFTKLGVRFLTSHLTRIFRTLIKRLEDSSTPDLIVLAALKTLECVLIAVEKDEKAIFRYEDDIHLVYPIVINLLCRTSSHATSVATIDVIVVLHKIIASPPPVADHQLLIRIITSVYNSSKGTRKEAGSLLNLVGQLGAVDPALQDPLPPTLHGGRQRPTPSPASTGGRGGACGGGGGGGGLGPAAVVLASENNRFPPASIAEEYSDTQAVTSDDNTVIVYKALTRLLASSHSEAITSQGLRTLLKFIYLTMKSQKDKIDGILAAHYLIQIVKRSNESQSLRLEALRSLSSICTLRHEKIVRNMLPEIVVLLEQIWAPSDNALFSATLDVVVSLKPGKLSEKEHSESWEWLYPRLMAVAFQDRSESRDLCLRVVEIVLTASYIPSHCLPIIFPTLLHFMQQSTQSQEVRSQSLCAAVHVVGDLKASEYTPSLMQGIRTIIRHCEMCDELGNKFGSVGVLESLKMLSALLPSARPTIRRLVDLITHKGPGEHMVAFVERPPFLHSPPAVLPTGASALHASNPSGGSTASSGPSLILGGIRSSSNLSSRYSSRVMENSKRVTAPDHMFLDEEEEVVDTAALPDEICDSRPQDIGVFLRHIEWGMNRKKMKEWFLELQKYIILVSPDPAIRMMSDLATKHDSIRRELFNPAFKAIYEVLSAEQIRRVKLVMNSVLQGTDNELVIQCLSLADYFEHNPPKISPNVMDDLFQLETMDVDGPHGSGGAAGLSSNNTTSTAAATTTTTTPGPSSTSAGTSSDPSLIIPSLFGVTRVLPLSSFTLDSVGATDGHRSSPQLSRPFQPPIAQKSNVTRKTVELSSFHEETAENAISVMYSEPLNPLVAFKSTNTTTTGRPVPGPLSTSFLFSSPTDAPNNPSIQSDPSRGGFRTSQTGKDTTSSTSRGEAVVEHRSPPAENPDALHYLSPAGRMPIHSFPVRSTNLFTPQQIVRAVERTRLYDKAVNFFESSLLQATSEYGLHHLPWETIHTVVLPLAWLYNKRDMRTSVVGLFDTIHYKGDVDAGRGYELLGAWEDAQRVYARTIGSSANIGAMPLRLIEGYIRSLFFSAEWSKALDVVQQVHPDVLRSSVTLSRCAATAAWVMGRWEEMLAFSGSPSNDRSGTPLLQFFSHIPPLHHAIAAKDSTELQSVKNLTSHARLSIGETSRRLLTLSYNHAYEYVSILQHYTEIEELIDYCTSRLPKRKTQLVQRWEKRFSQMKSHSPQLKLHTLLLFSMVLPVQELSSMILDFCETMSEQFPKLTHWAMNWLQDGALPHATHPFSHSRPAFIHSNPQVNVGYISHMWSQGRRTEAIQGMQYFLKEHHHILETKFPSIYAAAELRLGKWKHEIHLGRKWKTENEEESFEHFYRAIRADPSSYEAWHSWALINYRAHQSGVNVKDQRRYVEAAHQGFAAAICRCTSATDALPAIMRLLQLWVIHDGVALLKEMVADIINRIPVDYWVQAISQLIGHLNNESYDIREVISMVLCRVAEKHPQAVIFPLLVVSMSREEKSHTEHHTSSSTEANSKLTSPITVGPQTRKKELVQSIIQHCPKQIRVEAELVAKLLVDVSAIPIEKIREHLSEVAAAWNPHAEIEVDREEVRRRLRSVLEIFSQNRRHLLYTVGDVGQYVHVVLQHEAAGETSKALGIIKQLVDEISKHVSEKLGKEPQRAMEPLLRLRNLTIAVFGEYDISNGGEPSFPTIASFSSVLEVIPSKKRPRKIQLSGSDGKLYMYCLKGNEDIRLDERVMQLFGMVNVLLLHARVNSAASIHRFPVIPISASVGLLGWVQKSNTINSIICDYRVNVSQVRAHHESNVLRNYVESIGNWEKLSIIQRAEALDYVMHCPDCAAMDVANTMWYLSSTAEQWLDRRSTYSASLATMSMVGYVLGLGDRHLGNILLSIQTGKAIHIDFGDSFEVGRLRHVLPETIPFRLTRMLSNAMEVFGVNGSFRASAITAQRVLRSERDSIMSLLSAFIYDPIVQDKGNVKSIMEKSRSPQDIVERIRRKLQGTELAVSNDTVTLYHANPESARRPDLLYMSKVYDAVAPRVASMAFSTEKQVNFLIDEATRLDNYTVLFVGWGPLW